MRIVVDMSLSPRWIAELSDAGLQAIHWSQVGAMNAPDSAILQWARDNDYVVLTHDLDFSAILAATQSDAPSVVQVRGQNVLPSVMAPTVIAAMRQFGAELERGALVLVSPGRQRVRILPLRR